MFIPTLKKILLPGIGTKRNSISVVFKHEAYIKEKQRIPIQMFIHARAYIFL